MSRAPIERRALTLVAAALLTPGAAGADAGPYAYRFAPVPAPEAVPPKIPAITARYSARYRACLNDPQATTYSLDTCYQAEMTAQDVALNRQWVARFALLSAVQKPALRRAERGWIAARKAYCDKWSDDYKGGTMVQLVYGSCYVDETIRRTIWLEHLR